MAILIKVDRTQTEVFPADSMQGFTLAELYEYIGQDCECIEVIPLPKSRLMMVVDEEGKVKPEELMRVNQLATEIYWDNDHPPINCIVGNAIICDRTELQ